MANLLPEKMFRNKKISIFFKTARSKVIILFVLPSFVRHLTAQFSVHLLLVTDSLLVNLLKPGGFFTYHQV